MALTFPPRAAAAVPPAPGSPAAAVTSAPAVPAAASRPPVPRSAGGTRRLLPLLALATLLVGGALAYSWLNRPAAEVYRVGRGVAVSAVYGTVSINAQMVMTYFAQSTGNIHLDPGIGKGSVTSQGVRVTNGQLLAGIEDEITTRQLAVSRAEQAAAQAAVKAGPGQASALDGARDQLRRLESVSGTTVPVAQVAAARANVAQLEATVANERNTLQLRLDQATLAVRAQENQLKRSEIRSTLDGVLTAPPPNDGALVFVNNPLFTVATESTYVAGQVNEEDVGGLKPGMAAEIRLYSYGGRDFPATLDAILPSADTSNQRYTTLLHLNQPPDNILAGMTGEMNIIIGKHSNALLIPARALRDREPNSGDRVFVVENGVVAQRTIKVGYRNPETVEVLDGLKEGDEVVTAEQDLFAAGQRVRTVAVNPKSLQVK